MTFTFSLPTEWSLTITSSQRKIAWQYSQSLSYHRQEAYSDALCFDVFFSWFQAEYDPEAKAWLSPRERQGLWGMVTGSIVISQGKRLLLLPNETSDTDILEVPQEWVDIPTWSADYILAIQMDPAGERLAVWSYTTQAEVKAQGIYDDADRTYALESSNLQRDLNTLSSILQYCPNAVTQTAPIPLRCLDESLAINLIQRVGNPECAFPRQAVPFQQWGALLDQVIWRQLLSKQRLCKPSVSLVTRLSTWFQPMLDESWKSLDMLLGENLGGLVTNLRSEELSSNSLVRRGKQIELVSERDTLTVILLIQINSEVEDRMGVLIQLHPNQGECYIPAEMEFCLCAPAGNVLQSIQAQSQDNYIQFNRFRCPVGTRFHVEIRLEDAVMFESFFV